MLLPGQAGERQDEMTGSPRGQHSVRHLAGRNDTVPGEIMTPYPTVIHLAVEWEIEGDDNLNGSVTVHYRAVGDKEWRQGMPLRRVPKQTWYNEPPGDKEVLKFTWANKHSGTIFNLCPDTEYEIVLQLRDPDGGQAERTIRVRTRPVPKAKKDAPVKRANPKTFPDVLQDAQPGDILLLDAGNYGYLEMPHSGEPNRPIVIRSASVQSADGDAIYLDADNPPGGGAYANHRPLKSREGEVIFEGISLRGCKHVYLEGLVSFGTVTLWHADYCAVSRCRIYGMWGITSSARQGLAGWLPRVASRLEPFPMPTNTDTVPRAKCTNCYIADNEVIGITPWRRPTIGAKGKNMGEGIEIAGAGNVICYNRVTGFRDNISFMEGVFAVDQHCNDIYNNDIDGGVDDGIEADYYMSNCRILRNRFTNCHRGISAGPGMGGPLYIIRNVMYNLLTHPFDTNRACSGAVVLHNTSIKTDHAVSWNYGSSYLTFYNNLCIGGGDLGGRPAMVMPGSDKSCDHDYNGLGVVGAAFEGRVDGDMFAGIQGLRTSGREKHAVEVGLDVFAASVDFPDPPLPARAAPDLRLARDSVAVDAGRTISGINDEYTGDAPDLGAYELGQKLPIYGPRPIGMDQEVSRVEPLAMEP